MIPPPNPGLSCSITSWRPVLRLDSKVPDEAVCAAKSVTVCSQIYPHSARTSRFNGLEIDNWPVTNLTEKKRTQPAVRRRSLLSRSSCGFSLNISRYNAALFACTSAGLSTAGRCFVCLIDGLWVCRTYSILTGLLRFAKRYSASILRTSAISTFPEGSGVRLLRIQMEKYSNSGLSQPVLSTRLMAASTSVSQLCGYGRSILSGQPSRIGLASVCASSA